MMRFLLHAALVSRLLVSAVSAQADDSHVLSFVVPASPDGIASILKAVRNQCQEDDVISVSVDGDLPVPIAVIALICYANLDFSNANVSGRRTRPSSAFQWYAGSGLLVIWRGSRHARAITFGFP